MSCAATPGIEPKLNIADPSGVWFQHIPLPSPRTHTTHTAPHNTDFLVVYPKGPSPVGVLLTILIPVVLGGYAVFMYLDTHQVRVSL